ncbi:hypothetical protein DPMN_014005 [Dreissena polymorpha]|uniref:Uncharacterized protein n=1 Tax=Dreissena polymorpha TaxID=45954 RepID=A0A9D4N579_DREPO|nr:hypothetical protein DPMN_014005 [Dreissena polymorpha]
MTTQFAGPHPIRQCNLPPHLRHRNTWLRDLDADAEQKSETWGQLERLPQNRGT